MIWSNSYFSTTDYTVKHKKFAELKILVLKYNICNKSCVASTTTYKFPKAENHFNLKSGQFF